MDEYSHDVKAAIYCAITFQPLSPAIYCAMCGRTTTSTPVAVHLPSPSPLNPPFLALPPLLPQIRRFLRFLKCTQMIWDGWTTTRRPILAGEGGEVI